MPDPIAPQSADALPRLRVVCSYCPEVIEAGDAGARVSHGVCDACYRRESDAIDRLVEGMQARAEAFAHG